MPIIVEWNSRNYRKPNYYQIWRYEDAGCFDGIKCGVGYWYSVKHGWLAARKENVRHYSTFRTKQAAQRTLDTLRETKESSVTNGST